MANFLKDFKIRFTEKDAPIIIMTILIFNCHQTSAAELLLIRIEIGTIPICRYIIPICTIPYQFVGIPRYPSIG